MARCERHGLAYDPTVASGCVVCRREASQGPSSPSSGKWLLVLLCLVTFGVAGAAVYLRARSLNESGADATRVRPVPETEGELATKNGSGRASYFYLPPREKGRAIPLLVGLHGTGADGREMIGVFKSLASAREFAIVAPSSEYVAEARQFTWRVGDHPNDFSPDYRHVEACVREMEARTDVVIDDDRVLAVGFSGGGSSAPYLATNTLPYSAFAVLHGGVFIGGVGPRKVRGWFSTGEDDTIRSPEHVKGQHHEMQTSGYDVVYSTFPGGHDVLPAEAEAVVKWWLEPG